MRLAFLLAGLLLILISAGCVGSAAAVRPEVLPGEPGAVDPDQELLAEAQHRLESIEAGRKAALRRFFGALWFHPDYWRATALMGRLTQWWEELEAAPPSPSRSFELANLERFLYGIVLWIHWELIETQQGFETQAAFELGKAREAFQTFELALRALPAEDRLLESLRGALLGKLQQLGEELSVTSRPPQAHKVYYASQVAALVGELGQKQAKHLLQSNTRGIAAEHEEDLNLIVLLGRFHF